MQLVPDIEFRLDDVSKKKSKERNTTTTDDLADIYTPDDEQYKIEDDSSDEDITDKDLLLHIQKKMSKCELFCAPKLEQKTMHISQLPVEIILYIFRWVVSSDLDLRSLEMCSMVCRGFYLCSRDSEIWRLACVRYVIYEMFDCNSIFVLITYHFLLICFVNYCFPEKMSTF